MDYVCSQCCDDTTSHGRGLPNLKPTALAEDSNEVNNMTKMSLQVGGHGRGLLVQDTLRLN